jgi:ribosome-associated translation inhibitor RaiA
MVIPLEISFHNTAPIGDAETRIRQELAELEKFYHQILSCRVDVEVPEQARRGSVSKIRIDLTIPGKRPSAMETKEEVQRLEIEAEHKDVCMAIHAAFNTAHCRLQEFI